MKELYDLVYKDVRSRLTDMEVHKLFFDQVDPEQISPQ